MDNNWRLEYALKEHAYAMGQSVLALAKIEGMKIENLKAIDNGELPPYGEAEFEKAMLDFSIDHNSIIGAFTY